MALPSRSADGLLAAAAQLAQPAGRTPHHTTGAGPPEEARTPACLQGGKAPWLLPPPLPASASCVRPAWDRGVVAQPRLSRAAGTSSRMQPVHSAHASAGACWCKPGIARKPGIALKPPLPCIEQPANQNQQQRPRHPALPLPAGRLAAPSQRLCRTRITHRAASASRERAIMHAHNKSPAGREARRGSAAAKAAPGAWVRVLPESCPSTSSIESGGCITAPLAIQRTPTPHRKAPRAWLTHRCVCLGSSHDII